MAAALDLASAFNQVDHVHLLNVFRELSVPSVCGRFHEGFFLQGRIFQVSNHNANAHVGLSNTICLLLKECCYRVHAMVCTVDWRGGRVDTFRVATRVSFTSASLCAVLSPEHVSHMPVAMMMIERDGAMSDNCFMAAAPSKTFLTAAPFCS